jgi:hypothetical protein
MFTKKSIFRVFSFLFALAFTLVQIGPVFAYDLSSGAAGDRYGTSIARDGNLLVVGAPYASVGGNANQGTAYAYDCSVLPCTQKAQLFASNGNTTDYFGVSVAIKNGLVIIGASGKEGASPAQGAVYVFDCSGVSCAEQDILYSPTPTDTGNFGNLVAISGTTVVAGAVHENYDNGRVYVFDCSVSSDCQLKNTLSAPDSWTNRWFGSYVAIDGTLIAIGAYAEDISGRQDQGSAYVFSCSDNFTNCSTYTKLIASDGVALANFGRTVAVSGTTVVVGARGDVIGGNAWHGSAYIYDCSSLPCSTPNKITASDGAAGDYFGVGLVMKGSTLFIGSSGSNTGQGSAYVFQCTGTTCAQSNKLVAADGAAGDGFGYSLDFEGGTFTVGAPTDDVSGSEDQGSIYFYNTISGNAGIAGATLSYTDDTAKTATADSSGNYSFTISYNWSGSVTPSKTGYTFSPTSLPYTSVHANQTAQNYTAYGWNTNVRVNDDVGSAGQDAPNIIADNDGNLYLAWRDLRDGGPYGIYFAKSADGGQTWGANVKVNDGSSADVNWPNLAMDSSGTLYLVWGDSRNGSDDIYFAKSTNGGTTWSANTKVSDDSGSVNAWSPSLVVDSSDNLYVTWTDNRGGNWDNYFAKSINGGTTWSTSVKVNDDVSSTTNGRPSKLVIDNSGNLHLVWSTANGGSDLYSATSTNGGTTWSARVRINDVAGQVWLSSPPGLTVDDSGNLYTIWNDNRDFVGKSHIYFSKSTDGGGTWSANVDASNNPNGTNTVYLMGLVVDSNGTLSAIWGDSREGDEWNVYFARSTNGGANWNSAIRVNDNTTLAQYQVILAIDGNDNLYAAWADQRNGNFDIYSSRWNNQYPSHVISGNADVAGATLSYTDGTAKTVMANSNGDYFLKVSYNWSGTVTPSKAGYIFSPSSTPYTSVLTNQTAQNYTAFGWNANVRVNDDVGSAGQDAPNTIADNDGNLYLAWRDSRDGGPYGIYFAKSADGGQTWGANVKVNDGSSADVNWPNLAMDSSGTLYLVWGDSRNGSDDIYFAKSTNGGTTWSANTKVSDDSGSVNAWSPSLVVDSSDNLYVTWTDNRGGNWDNYFAKSINGGTTWSTSVKVNDDVSSTTNGRPSKLVIDNSGNLHLVWSTANGGSDLYSATSTNGGTTWSARVRINDVAGQVWLSSPPGLTVDDSGNLYTIWNDNRDFVGKSHIYFSKSTDGGGTWSANVDASNNPNGTNTVYLMGLVVDSNGTLSAIWGDSREGDEWNVYFARSTNGGANWNSAIRVNDNTTLAQYQVILAIDGNDNLYAAWADQRNGNFDIYSSRWNNQYPSHVISGNADVAGATLSYTDGTAKTVMANSNGDYFLKVSYNWSGTVTPSKAGYTFSPVNTSYANVLSSQTAQNYTAIPVVQRAKNGGFNTYSGTSKVPKYWVKSTNFASTDGKDTSIKKEGAASVRISGVAGKTKTLTQTLSLSGAKGQPFAFSYWVKGSAMPTKGSCYGQVLFYYGTNLKGTKTLKCPTGATYTWKQVNLNLTAPAAYNKVLIRFTYSKASGRVWFDLASLLR